MAELDSIEAVVAAWRALTASQRVEVQRLAGPPRRSTPSIVHLATEREMEAEGFTKTGQSSHAPARWRPPATSRAALVKEHSQRVSHLEAQVGKLERENESSGGCSVPTEPKPPTDLDAESKRVWRQALDELQEAGVWTGATAPLLTLYVRSLQSARQARSRIAARLAKSGETRRSSARARWASLSRTLTWLSPGRPRPTPRRTDGSCSSHRPPRRRSRIDGVDDLDRLLAVS